MKYLLHLIVDTEDDIEIEETYLEGDKAITKYLEKIGEVGGDFLRLVVMKESNKQ